MKSFSLGTIADVIDRTCSGQGERTFLFAQDEEISYAKFRERVHRSANALRAMGIGKGDCISIYSANRPEFLYVWLGAAVIGAISAPVNYFFQEAESIYVINHSEATVLFIQESSLDLLRRIGHKLERIKRIFVFGNDPGGQYPSFASLIEGQAPEAAQAQVDPDEDLAGYMYTSGTTGFPKGCMLTHSFYLNVGEQVRRQHKVTPADRWHLPLPLFHVGAQCYGVMTSLTSGCQLILRDRFHGSTYWDDVRQTRATILHTLGVIPSMLYSLPPSPDDRQHSVRLLIQGGMARSVHAAFQERFGIPVLEGFGMSETGVDFFQSLDDPDRLVGQSCVGKPLPHREACIVDDDDNELPVGEIGEVCLRGQHLMKGYFKEPEATAVAFRNGWFHTGDNMRRDERGYFYFVDRKKDIIRRSGENISSVEIENVIRAVPGIADVAVVPAPDRIREEEVKACVVLSSGETPATVTPQAIIEACKADLAYFKVPRYILYLNELPKTPTNKVQKAVLRRVAKPLAGCWDVTRNEYLPVDYETP